MQFKLRINVLIAVFSLLNAGCVFGPNSLLLSRANYNAAVQQTAREEMLLNLVRLKYHQSEEFIRVPSITGQYTYDADFGGSGGWQDGVAAKLGLSFGLGATSKPTIVFTPEQAQEFNRRLLSPIGPETLDLLTSKGWAIDRVMRVTVRNINDVDNATSAGGPTPTLKPEFEEFIYLSECLRALQKYGRRIEIAYEEYPTELVRLSDELPVEKVDSAAVVAAAEKGFQFLRSDDGDSYSLWTQPSTSKSLVLRIAPEAIDAPETDEIRRILELAPALNTYEIQLDTLGQLRRPHTRRLACDRNSYDRREIVVSTRSLKEMMFYLSHGIEVPECHSEAGLVRQSFDDSGHPFDWQDMSAGLFDVKFSSRRPKSAAVRVKYRDHWFYIEETDLESKSTFNLLLELFNLEIRAGGGGQIPLLAL